MAFTERLALLITGDASGAIREFQKVGNAAEKDLGKAKTNIDKVGSRLQIGGAAAVGFAAVAGKALFSFAKESESAHAASLKLDNTLHNQPQLAGANKKAFTDLATALQKKTAADDDAIVSGQALLGQFGLTQKQILNITPLVVDLSRKMGVDLDTASKAVGKSVDGSAGALKKMGIVVDATKFKSDSFGATMDALKGTVGGFAVQEGKTFSGRLEILKNQIGEVKEGIGAGVVDAFSKAVGPVTKLSESFAGLDPHVQSTIGEIATFGTIGIGAVGAISAVAGSVLKARNNFKTLSTEMPRTLTLLKGVGIAAGVVGAAFAGWQILESIGALKTAGGTAEDAARSIDRLGKSSKATGTAATAFGKDFEHFKSAIEAAGDKSLYDKIDQGGQRFNQTVEKLSGGLLDGGHKTIDYAQAVDKLDKQLAQLVNNGDGQKAVKTFQEFKKHAEENGVSIDVLNRAFNDYNKALGDATTGGDLQAVSAKNASTANADLSDRVTEANKALEEQAQKDKAANDALRSYTDTIYANRDAQRALDDANNTLGDDLTTYTEKVKEASKHGFKNAEANREWQKSANAVKADLDKEGKAAGALADQQALLFGHTNSAAESARAQRQRLLELQATIKPGNPFRSYLDGLIADLDRVTGERHVGIHVTVNGREIQATSSGDLLNAINVIGGRGFRAKGGPVEAGSPYIVGEEGPELFVPKTSGTIVPNGKTSTFRGAGGNVIQVTIPATIYASNRDDGAQIVAKLTSAVRSGQGRTELLRALGI